MAVICRRVFGKSYFRKNRKCTEHNAERPQNGFVCYKGKGSLYMFNYHPQAPNFTPFCSAIACFPDNWGFWFLYRLQWWIYKFQKKNRLKSETQNFKNLQCNFVRTIRRKFRTSVRTLGHDLHEWHFEIFTPIGSRSHVNEKE